MTEREMIRELAVAITILTSLVTDEPDKIAAGRKAYRVLTALDAQALRDCAHTEPERNCYVCFAAPPAEEV